jgi:hypothetical protein
MSRVVLGAICGLAFGAIDVGIMLPMTFPDKKAAITAAFIARFGIGFVIGSSCLPWPGWCVGLLFGLLLSIPDAIITKSYAPNHRHGRSWRSHCRFHRRTIPKLVECNRRPGEFCSFINWWAESRCVLKAPNDRFLDVVIGRVQACPESFKAGG